MLQRTLSVQHFRNNSTLYSFPGDTDTNLFDLLAPIIKVLLRVAEKALKKKVLSLYNCRLILSVLWPRINAKEHDQDCKQLQSNCLASRCGLHSSVKLDTPLRLDLTSLLKYWRHQRNGLLCCTWKTGQKQPMWKQKAVIPGSLENKPHGSIWIQICPSEGRNQSPN